MSLHDIRLVAVALGATLVACQNPTVDPNASFSAQGVVTDERGLPLQRAEVRLVRYFHDSTNKNLEPSVDDLFTCQAPDCSYPELDLELGMVRASLTDDAGGFALDFLGRDIAARAGAVDEEGKVEVSRVVLVVVDPRDPTGRAGVFTYDHLYSERASVWDAETLSMWDAQAEADTTITEPNGIVRFTWNALDPPKGAKVQSYRLEIGGETSERLIIRCDADGSDPVQGGCAQQPGGRLGRDVSAFSIFAFYSDSGRFSAHVTGDGPATRARAEFLIDGMPRRPARAAQPVRGAWATSPTQNQSILGTLATDGRIETQQNIDVRGANAIYIQLTDGLSSPLVTDAGILNTIVTDAHVACATIEFSTSSPTSLGEALGLTDWVKKGRFCGNGTRDNTLSAVINFQPDPQTAGWLRISLSTEDLRSVPSFLRVGEITVFAPGGH